MRGNRVKALNLTQGDMPDGYYIYNPEQEMTTWKLDSQTVYNFIDWNGIYTGSDYPKECSFIFCINFSEALENT